MRRWQRLAGLGTSLLFATTLASTSAMALFYPQASLEQMSLQTANISLLVSPDPQGAQGSFVRNTSFSLLQSLRSNDQEHTAQFWVKNASAQGVNFRLRLKLDPGDRDWSLLKHHIQLKVQSIAPAAETAWRSLAEWEETAADFPGALLVAGESRPLKLLYRLPSTYKVDPDGTGPKAVGDPIGEELVGKITGGVEFILEGREE